jgi:hypothetical protein
LESIFGSGIIVSQSARLHNESVSKATAAASAQVCKVCIHRAIPGYKTVSPCYGILLFKQPNTITITSLTIQQILAENNSHSE